MVCHSEPEWASQGKLPTSPLSVETNLSNNARRCVASSNLCLVCIAILNKIDKSRNSGATRTQICALARRRADARAQIHTHTRRCGERVARTRAPALERTRSHACAREIPTCALSHAVARSRAQPLTFTRALVDEHLHDRTRIPRLSHAHTRTHTHICV